MSEQSEYYNDEDDEAIEAYCVRCKNTIEVEDPLPVWTRRGMPATRGECPDCGGTVFRMGYTHLHNRSDKPDAVQVAGRSRAKLARDTAYIAFAEADESAAQQIAADLEKTGIACWLHGSDEHSTQWAEGVHPALTECARMVLVLSPAALAEPGIETTWRFFKDKRKPVIIAQIDAAEPPDAVRRSPRFDFASDYKAALRQLVQALSA